MDYDVKLHHILNAAVSIVSSIAERSILKYSTMIVDLAMYLVLSVFASCI